MILVLFSDYVMLIASGEKRLSFFIIRFWSGLVYGCRVHYSYLLILIFFTLKLFHLMVY